MPAELRIDCKFQSIGLGTKDSHCSLLSIVGSKDNIFFQTFVPDLLAATSLLSLAISAYKSLTVSCDTPLATILILAEASLSVTQVSKSSFVTP
jgi:hypothetical protein